MLGRPWPERTEPSQSRFGSGTYSAQDRAALRRLAAAGGGWRRTALVQLQQAPGNRHLYDKIYSLHNLERL
jgi:hypothetical protein